MPAVNTGVIVDKVFIKNLEIEAIIGIYDFERTTPQKVVLDMEMSWDNRKPAHSEDIADALNYKTISDHLKQFVGNSECQLIETLAEQIAKIILKDYGVAWVSLTLHKPDALEGSTDVGVNIVREAKTVKPRPGFLA